MRRGGFSAVSRVSSAIVDDGVGEGTDLNECRWSNGKGVNEVYESEDTPCVK